MRRRKLSWSEPWDWKRAKQGVRAAGRAMPFRRFAVYGLAIPLAAALVVRFGVEGAGEVLAFWQITVPIWVLAVGQIAWLLGAYAVGRHWRSEKPSA